jgi:hypothetical protein
MAVRAKLRVERGNLAHREGKIGMLSVLTKDETSRAANPAFTSRLTQQRCLMLALARSLSGVEKLLYRPD